MAVPRIEMQRCNNVLQSCSQARCPALTTLITTLYAIQERHFFTTFWQRLQEQRCRSNVATTSYYRCYATLLRYSIVVGTTATLFNQIQITRHWTVHSVYATCAFYGIGRCTLQWRHNERDGVSNHQGLDCLLNRLFRCRSKKTSKLRVTGLCEGNSPVNSPHRGPLTRKMFPFLGLSGRRVIVVACVCPFVCPSVRLQTLPCPEQENLGCCCDNSSQIWTRITKFVSILYTDLGRPMGYYTPNVLLSYKQMWKCRLQNGSHFIPTSVCFCLTVTFIFRHLPFHFPFNGHPNDLWIYPLGKSLETNILHL